MTATDGSSGDSPKGAHYGRLEDPRMTAEEMDLRRKENIAYEYLCHLEEAKVWIEACINEKLPTTTELEEGLRNGVYLAKLAHFISPDLVPLKRIYDRDQARFKARGLHFRHTDNINHWFRALEEISLPKIFYPETTDIYDRKNMPRVIYCIHALSLYLFKLGRAPQIQDLYGKIKFTDEEISAMRKELEKYGIQMPAFSKIGGILANEMPVDEAALHAAVIAINEAIDHQVAAETLEVLQVPAAHLVNIYPELADMYQQLMHEAKHTKAENARNKSLDPDSSYIPDVYDELLTQAEIQGNINKVNTYFALEQLNEALDADDQHLVAKRLQMPQLNLRDVRSDNTAFYMTCLLDARDFKKNNNSGDTHILSQSEVQMSINAANLEADADYQKLLAIKAINEALDGDDPALTLRAIQSPRAMLPPVLNNAAPLYHEEFKNIRLEKQSELDHDEIIGGIQVLTAIAKINQAVETGNVGMTLQTLLGQDGHIMGVDPNNQEKYHTQLCTAKHAKRKNPCDLLTHYEIQGCINSVNDLVHEESERIVAVGVINDAIDSSDPPEMLEALKMPTAKLQGVEDTEAVHYHSLLGRCKKEKVKESADPSAVLWYEEIQSTIEIANQHAAKAESMSMKVSAINMALHEESEDDLLTCLGDPDLFLHSVTPECAATYQKKLKAFSDRKAQSGDSGSGWMMNRTKEGYKFYYNINTCQHSWDRPDGVKKDHSLLTREEIQNCVNEVTAAHDRQLLFKSNEKFVVKVQARIRGFLARKQYNERLAFLYTKLPAIVKIQAWWRMILQNRKFFERLRFLQSQEQAACVIQAAVKMYLCRKHYHDRLNYLKENESAVVKIQSFMRTNWAKQDYKMLMHGTDPPISLVRKFVHLLDQGDLDYTEEIDLQKLRQHVVSEVRSNQKLENDLNQMDIKIGLLVKNRITLQDVVSQHRSLKQYRDNSSSSLHKGLKALSKHSRERLEAYQHLFYLLQTNPNYLAKLIFEMPQSRTTKFMESVILTIYNYASNQREEYLLLKLFKTALKEEINSKVDKMSDIVTGNPLVVKMIVSFNRNARGQGALRDLLNPLVKEVLEDRNLLINTNPVEVYKSWVNQMETESGRASGLPYDVTLEQALQHEEVRERINQSVDALQKATDKFLVPILESVNKIPYGMRYMAKVLGDALRAKFPEAPEKDVLKIIGNLIYYRYINSAIVAPDAFDIVDITAYKGLTNDQRRNLGSIAKILQFAASNKGFGGESAHLASLNPYIMEAHNKFKKYFKAVCDVEEPEMQYNVDQYTDITRVTKPVIYISIAEIIETHKLLLEHQDTVAPDHNDPLHELLEDLGDAPDAESLIGDAGIEEAGMTSKMQLAKTEISLTLSNKFEVPETDESDIQALLLRTKRMVVDVIRCQIQGHNLVEVLGISATDEEEDEHQALIKKRERVDQRAVSKKAKLVRQQSMIGDTRLPLDSMKIKIQNNLNQLEESGVVARSNKYQAIINSIVQDIRNQRLYRQRRKQEMLRLRNTVKSLNQKRAFYEEQIDYYNRYVKTCLDNLSTKGKKSGRRVSIFNRESTQKAKGSIKYSAAKLHEKGVVLEIEGLPPNQFKNVLFEICATETAGLFDVNAKFMGVNMEKVELVFQDLLQLQYEGVAVMKMFDKARVNVNLLIFLLNKKFYGKNQR